MSESSSAAATVAADGATVSAAASVTAVSAVAAEVQGTLDVKTLLAALRAATEEECCEILTALHKGMPLYAERMDGSATNRAPSLAGRHARPNVTIGLHRDEGRASRDWPRAAWA